MSNQNFSLNFAAKICVFLCAISLACAAEKSTPTTVNLERDADGTYQQAIESIEKERGAHDFALVEPAIGLGVNYQLQNQHDKAIEAFKQALHVNRINRGLHDLDHIPIIDLIAHSQMRLGDWEGAEQQQRLRFWIYQREIETSTDVSAELLNNYIDATLHLTAWQGKSFTKDTGRFPLVKLRQAQSALSDAKERLAAQSRTRDARYFRLLNAMAVNNYNIVVHLSDNEVDPVSGSYGGDQDMSDYLLRQNIITDSYREGTSALEEIMTITNSEAQGLEHAMAILNYADWQILFNRPQTAAKEYQRAHDAFIAAGIDKPQLDKRFAEPQRISSFELSFGGQPDDPDTIETAEPALKVRDSGPNTPFVLAVFDVTRKGEVRNVDIENSWPDNDRNIRRQTRNRLVSSKFRPALLDGKPVVSKDVKIRYLFTNYGSN